MAHPPAPALVLRDGDEEELRRLVRASSGRAGLAQRARIVLLAAEGIGNTQIAQRVGASRQSVVSWRARYDAEGIDGLHDRDRSGRPRQVDAARVIAATLTPMKAPPARAELSWMARATISLPVPVSPWINTVESSPAARLANRLTSRIAALVPM